MLNYFHSSKMNIYYFSCTLTCPDEDQNSLSVKCKVDLSRLFLEKGKNAHAGTPVRDIPFLFFRGGGAEGTPVPKSNIQYCHNHFSYSVMYKAVFSHHFTRKSANKAKWWKGYLKKCPRPPDLKFVAIVTTNGCVKYFPAVQITPKNNTSSWKFAQKF